MRTSSRRVPSYAAPMAESTVIGEANEATGALGPARLVVVNGAVAGSAVALGDDETTIGRARANDVVLPDISVSRRHAVLRRVANGYVVVDRASGNGTRINGRSVRVARLQDGDEIALGDPQCRRASIGRFQDFRMREPRQDGSHRSIFSDSSASCRVRIAPQSRRAP